MSIRGVEAARDEFELPQPDDLPPTFDIGTQQPGSASVEVVEDQEAQIHDGSSNESSSPQSGSERDDDEDDDEEEDIDSPEVSDAEEFSSEIEVNPTAVTTATAVAEVAVTEAISAALKAKVDVAVATETRKSIGKKVAGIASIVEPKIAEDAANAQKEADAKNAAEQAAAAELAKVEAARKPEAEIASDAKLQAAKDAHKDQAAQEEKARLAALQTVPAIAHQLADEAKVVADAKLPTIHANAEAVLEQQSKINKAAEAAAAAHKKVEDERAAKGVGKMVKPVEVIPSTIKTSVGKLPPKLAERFADTIKAAETATDAVKLAVAPEEHGQTKTMVKLFETKTQESAAVSTTAVTTPAPTRTIGKVVSSFK